MLLLEVAKWTATGMCRHCDLRHCRRRRRRRPPFLLRWRPPPLLLQLLVRRHRLARIRVSQSTETVPAMKIVVRKIICTHRVPSKHSFLNNYLAVVNAFARILGGISFVDKLWLTLERRTRHRAVWDEVGLALLHKRPVGLRAAWLFRIRWPLLCKR